MKYNVGDNQILNENCNSELIQILQNMIFSINSTFILQKMESRNQTKSSILYAFIIKRQILFKLYLLNHFSTSMDIEHTGSSIKIIIRLTEPDSLSSYTDFPLTNRLFDAMEYLVEDQVLNEAINNNLKKEVSTRIMTISTRIASVFAFRTIIHILLEFNYGIPMPVKVKTNNPRDSIGPFMHDILKDCTNDQLIEIYKAAHFFKLYNLRLTIGAIFASHVYVGTTFAEYKERKRALGVQRDFTYADSVAMNNDDNEVMALKL